MSENFAVMSLGPMSGHSFEYFRSDEWQGREACTLGKASSCGTIECVG